MKRRGVANVKTYFFAGVEALNCLLNMEFEEPEKDNNLTLDFIDLPFWFSFQSNEKIQTLKVFVQSDMYIKDEDLAMEKLAMLYLKDKRYS